MIIPLRLVVPAELAGMVAGFGLAHTVGRLTFLGPSNVEEEELPGVLEAMTQLNVAWLQAHPEAPHMMDVPGVRFEREPGHENDYLAAPLVLGQLWNDYEAAVGHRPFRDCEDWSMMDAAQERIRGNPRAQAVAIPVSKTMRHIVTSLGDGRLRDISQHLMRTGRGNNIPWTL